MRAREPAGARRGAARGVGARLTRGALRDGTDTGFSLLREVNTKLAMGCVDVYTQLQRVLAGHGRRLKPAFVVEEGALLLAQVRARRVCGCNGGGGGGG